jgi:hypothetical protein
MGLVVVLALIALFALLVAIPGLIRDSRKA